LKYADFLLPLGAGDDLLMPLGGDHGLLPIGAGDLLPIGDDDLLPLGAGDDTLLPIGEMCDELRPIGEMTDALLPLPLPRSKLSSLGCRTGGAASVKPREIPKTKGVGGIKTLGLWGTGPVRAFIPKIWKLNRESPLSVIVKLKELHQCERSKASPRPRCIAWARSEEQLTLNQRVTGSSPVAPTNKIKDLG
jgi:hypothetical protein